MGDIWLDEYRADAVRTRPNRGVSRGDRGVCEDGVEWVCVQLLYRE